MSTIESFVIGSSQGEAFGFDEAKRYTGAAVWDLKPTSSEPPGPESTLLIDLKNKEPETVIAGRRKFDPKHIASSEKYRPIVKLFVHYEGQEKDGWAMGTGWLIRPDTFITAGHCSYDRAYGYGRAVHVKAYFGYSGHKSEKSPSVQFRHVKRIATTEGWLKGTDSKSDDVSFMQIDVPFDSIIPIVPKKSPVSGVLDLGVVGYPDDKKHPQTEEDGAEMYEMYRTTEFDLATQSEHMLEYLIDTFGGNSGSRVLKQTEGKLTSASVIGQWGNSYNNHLDALGADLPNDFKTYTLPLDANTPLGAPAATPNEASGKVPVSGGVDKIAVPKPISGGEKFDGSASRGRLSGSGEENFMDILGAAETSIFMFGGPYGALSGCVINAMGQLLENVTGPESPIDASSLRQGFAERAILAEAALDVIQSGALPNDVRDSILQNIKSSATKALPVIRKVVPHLMDAMMEPALRSAFQSLQDYNKQQGATHEISDILPATLSLMSPSTEAIEQPTDRNVEDFIGQLNGSLKITLQESGTDEDTQEGWFEITRNGAGLDQGVLSVANAGLLVLVDYTNKSGSAEAFEHEISASRDAQYNTAFQLAKRALVADAALQALMKLPPGQLEEAWFENLASAVITITDHVFKAAPTIAKAIDPIVRKIVSGLVGQESAPES